jgi:pimeloyl-ACP methyl ester carboxylesterase
MRLRSLPFLIGFARSRRDVGHEREVLFNVDRESRPATVYFPTNGGRRSPVWVILQGAAVPGRHHEGVRRLARGLAAAGHLAFVPEIPAWSNLEVRPEEAESTVKASLRELADWPAADLRRLGIAGLSVAATWSLVVAAELGQPVRCVLGLGGYGDFHRAVLGIITGEHEWRGETFRHSPDPYGRWILGGDFLPSLEGDEYGTREERDAAARALRLLALTAGRNGALAATLVYDPLIDELRESLPERALRPFDLLAPTSSRTPEVEEQRRLAVSLAQAGLRRSPLLDTERSLGQLRSPAVLFHGRNDSLIPFTETLRLESMLPRAVERRVVITSIVGHAKTASLLSNPRALVRDLWQFAGAVDWFLAKFR